MTDAARQVVITGIGVVSPVGTGCQAFWEGMLAGRSGVAPITVHDMGTWPIRFAGQLDGFDAKRYVKPRKAIKVMCREVQVGVAAAALSMEHAELARTSVDADRFGVVFGSEMLYGLPHQLRDVFAASATEGRIDLHKWGKCITAEMFPLWLLQYLPNMPACHIGIAHQAFGPNNSIVQGEVSSLLAVAEATSVIQRGWAEVMIAGGGGTSINPTRCVYLSVDNLSHRSDDPASACRPFDVHRDGKVLGEGAAAFVLEERQHALGRGAVPLAEIMGFGCCFDPRWSTQRGPSSETIARSLRRALAQADCAPADIGHVNAHGLATKESDRREAEAILQELGTTPVTAPKSFFGCLSAGGGAVELAASVMAIHTGHVPVTLNYTHPDPACPVHVVCGEPLQQDLPAAVALNQSVTGQTVALVLRRVSDA